MNPNRKADLQRKLAMAPVPDPPAGLAERIKGEIPQDLHFDLEKDRARMSDSVALIMRVAASVLVIVSMAFFAMQILSRSSKREGTALEVDSIASQSRARTAAPSAPIVDAKKEVLVAANDPVLSRPPAPTRRPRAASNEVASSGVGIMAVPIREEVAADQVAALKSDATPAPTSETAVSAVSKTAAPEPQVAERVTVTNQAPMVAAAPVPPPPAPQAKDLARADQRAAAESRELKDENASTRGARFAAPPVLPTGELRVDVEATQSPFAAHSVLLRVSIDSGIAARDLRVDVLLGEDVSDKRWLAGSWRWNTALFDRQSATSVAEMTVGATADSPVAIVRATYRLRDGEQTIEKTLRRSDVKSWSAASSRTKAAILAAKSVDPALRRQAADLARDSGLIDLAAEIEKH
jgi:hypothetical protein